MSVGLLIITHNDIGLQLLQTATTMLGTCPLPAKALEVCTDCEPEEVAGRARGLLTELDSGDGVLILADIYGSTPGNIAIRLLRNARAIVIAGVNLPMLIRVLNYPRLGLEDLAEKALSGGRDGILLCRQDPWD
jgi:PTS system ascorbate-specific IIA component